MQWKVSRWAVLGPMPGSRPNSAASRSTAAGIIPIESEQARRQSQPGCELSHVLPRHLARLVERVVGGGEEHVGEQLGTFLHGLWLHGDRQQLLMAVGGDGDRAATRRPGDGHVPELVLQ